MDLQSISLLDSRLKEVGLFADADKLADLPPGIETKAWKSSYARLYIAQADAKTTIDWTEALARIDSKILAQLRSDELSGGVVDAHLCVLVDEDPKQVAQKLDEKALRHVTRKYFVSRRSDLDAIFARVTLLSVPQLPKLEGRPEMGLSTAEDNWLSNIVEGGPASAFDEFIASIGCAE